MCLEALSAAERECLVTLARVHSALWHFAALPCWPCLETDRLNRLHHNTMDHPKVKVASELARTDMSGLATSRLDCGEAASLTAAEVQTIIARGDPAAFRIDTADEEAWPRTLFKIEAFGNRHGATSLLCREWSLISPRGTS